MGVTAAATAAWGHPPATRLRPACDRLKPPRVAACSWDPMSAYGWTDQSDDEVMGWGRYTYTHRSTAWNSGLWFIQVTAA